MFRYIHTLLFVLALGYSALSSAERVVSGNVVSIADGDSFTVLSDAGELRVSLVDADAPESGQPYALQSRKALAGLIFDRTVDVFEFARTADGRVLARVEVSGFDVGTALIKDGHAWVARQSADDLALLGLERAARQQRIGLWNLPEAQRMPPWDWRQLTLRYGH